MISALSSFLIPVFLGGSTITAVPVDLEAERPQCVQASHDRLMIREGRDVCAPSLDDKGKARAVGFLPTGCAGPQDRMILDARDMEDVCLPPIANSSKKGK